MRARKLRVLHVIQNLNYGGMERLIWGMVDRADRQCFDMHILVLQYLGRFSEGMNDRATLHVASPQRKLSLVHPTQLARTMAQIAPDVVHTHSGVWLKASRAARMAGVPLTVHTEHGRRHSPDPLMDRITDHVAARFSDYVVAVSEPLVRHLASKLAVPPKKIRLINNGVDTRLHRPAPPSQALHRELGLDPATPILLSVGRLEAIKGYEVSIKALAALNAAHGPAPVLVLAGDGSERDRLQALTNELGLAGRVFMLGWRDDVEQLHACASLFIMSSHSEGTSVSLLEAMSAGLCPVVTDVGGNRAVLGPDLTHRLTPPNSPTALAAAWSDALLDETKRAADANRARARVEQTFSLEQMVRKYESLYESPLVMANDRHAQDTFRL